MTTSPPRSPETRYGALTKLCMWGRVGDVINHVQFHLNRFRGFGPSGGRISKSPIDCVNGSYNSVTHHDKSGTGNYLN